jgi:cytidine deaminase
MCCVQVDSGEWGRGRVAELTAAGELMRAERDALLKLVQALRREYEAVQLAKESQHDELRALKDKMTVKVSINLMAASGTSGTSVV